MSGYSDPNINTRSPGTAQTADAPLATWSFEATNQQDLEAEHPLLHTPEEAARLLRISRTAMFEMIASGEIGSVKIGRRRRVPRIDLNRYVARLREQAAELSAGPAA